MKKSCYWSAACLASFLVSGCGPINVAHVSNSAISAAHNTTNTTLPKQNSYISTNSTPVNTTTPDQAPTANISSPSNSTISANSANPHTNSPQRVSISLGSSTQDVQSVEGTPLSVNGPNAQGLIDWRYNDVNFFFYNGFLVEIDIWEKGPTDMTMQVSSQFMPT